MLALSRLQHAPVAGNGLVTCSASALDSLLLQREAHHPARRPQCTPCIEEGLMVSQMLYNEWQGLP